MRSLEAGIASAFLYAVMVRVHLPTDDPARMLALLDEARDVGARLGDRNGVATLGGLRGVLAVRAGDWRTALRVFVEAVQQHLELDEGMSYPAMYWSVVFAFAQLGAIDTAAVLMGFTDAHFERMLDEEGQVLLASTEEIVRDGLGERRTGDLAVRGAAFDLTTAVAYMQAESARVLEDVRHA